MSIELTIIIAVVSALIGYFTFQRNRDKDVKATAAESAVVATKLDAIGVGVESIRDDMKASVIKQDAFAERVIRVEEGVKQVSQRLDKFEGVRDAPAD